MMRKVKERLYNLLGRMVSIFFNLLNLLMAGNLPPLGHVHVLVKEHGCYLMLKMPNGKATLPGGFMRWRENPLEAAQRECEEETGLQVRILEMLGCLSYPAKSRRQVSILTLVYRAEVTGGHLRGSVEGQPIWISETEAKQRLSPHYRPFFEKYAHNSSQQIKPAQEDEPTHQEV